MGVRNRKVRRPRRLNKHDATLVRRRKKVRWLLAQRVRVRNYRRKFIHGESGALSDESGSAYSGDDCSQAGTDASNQNE